MNKRIYLSPPHMSGAEQKYIKEAFDSNWIAPLGPNVEAFENAVATYVGSNGAVALSSGTAGIHLALQLLGVGKGDKVFCSTLTFIASANPIVYLGAEPVFIDSENETWNMSPSALERAFQESLHEGILPKAVIIVNLYGQSARMEELLEICNKYNVPVIEDAAESLGSEYKGRKSGTFGKFGVFSFNGNKIITTSGGGMLVSNDTAALQSAKFLATQAREKAIHYQHNVVGYNYRLSNVLAGIGRAQMEVLDQRVKTKREVFNFYKKMLGEIDGIEFMPELSGTFSNRWLSVMLIDSEKTNVTPSDLIDALESENIEARPVWKPLHLQPVFKDCKYYPHSKTEVVSEKLFNTGICLPSGTVMTEIEQSKVVSIIRNLLVDSLIKT